MIKFAALLIVSAAAVFGISAGGAVSPVGEPSEMQIAAAVPLPTPVGASAVCSDPSAKCDHKQKHFDEWELPFRMPAKLADNKPYRSASFYAVMLRTFELDDDCDGGEYVIAVEKERKKVQKAHPDRKVFAMYQCPNMGAVDYDFVGKMDAKGENILIGNFLAIYAGPTKADADELLESVKAKYPEAVVKKMTASFEVINQ